MTLEQRIERVRQDVAKVVIKYNLGHKDALREDIGVLLNEAYEEGYQDALASKIVEEEKPKKVKKAKE